MRKQLQVVFDMKATHIFSAQRNYVVNRHVRTPCFGVDGIDDLPIRPSGSRVFPTRLSQAYSLLDLVVMPAVLLAVVPLEAFRVKTPGLP